VARPWIRFVPKPCSYPWHRPKLIRYPLHPQPYSFFSKNPSRVEPRRAGAPRSREARLHGKGCLALRKLSGVPEKRPIVVAAPTPRYAYPAQIGQCILFSVMVLAFSACECFLRGLTSIAGSRARSPSAAGIFGSPSQLFLTCVLLLGSLQY
jgi:hypothetical protein